jgi:phosphatidylethanolamine-binding protein (PEBP) family uncharacterized protein
LLKSKNYKQGFEVEDIRTRKNYTFVFDPFSQAVIGYDTSINQTPKNKQIFRYIKNFPFEKASPYEYFLYLYDKSTSFDLDNNTYFIGWINHYNFQPIEQDFDGEEIVEEEWQITLKTKLKRKHTELLKLIESEAVREIVNKDCYISGGAISSLIRNETPKDIDYFVTNQDSIQIIKEYFKNRFEISQRYKKENHRPITLLNGYNDIPIFYTENAITLCDNFQIILKDYGAPEDVCSRFDWVHCMGYYIPSTEELNVTMDTKIAAENKSMVYNVNSKSPLTSTYRMTKLLGNGWRIDRYEQSKLLININKYHFSEEELENIEDAAFYDF